MQRPRHAAAPEYGGRGLHVFAFNQVRQSETLRGQLLDRLASVRA
jgi:hypothetical protein